MGYNYTQEQEERITRIAREFNFLVPKIFSKERESMTLEALLELIEACESTLEQACDEKAYNKIMSIARHSYKNYNELKGLYAISVLVAESAVISGSMFRQVHPSLMDTSYYSKQDMKYVAQEIQECYKANRKCRKIKLKDPVAIIENSQKHFLCSCKCDENLVLFSRNKIIKLNELEFYTNDAKKETKKLKKYFGIK